MNKRKISLILILFIVLLPSLTFGGDVLPEPSYDFYVYDEAEIIDRDTEDYIININKDLYKKTGAQVVIATISSLENMDINYYATALFEKWQIGSREYDNGMLILIVPEERQLWIEVGYGLEGQFPDTRVKRIIDNFILPYFSEGEYSKGILAGFNQILLGLEEEYNITLDNYLEVDPPYYDEYSDGIGITMPRIFIIIGVLLFLFFDFKFFRGMITYSLLRGIGRGSRGFGGSYRGGRSSGGGGRSGGGGAGGRW
ncbi:MAG: TPM domain-containing protein [Tissierellia bacterium]|nr:TPM domain-containing protein [Tissierellia bacterium]